MLAVVNSAAVNIAVNASFQIMIFSRFVPRGGVAGRMITPVLAFEGTRCVCAPGRFRLRLTLCHPMDCSPPGSSVHGILQARILEWGAMPSSRGSSPPRDRILISYVSLAGGCFTARAFFHTYSGLRATGTEPTTAGCSELCTCINPS